MQKPRINSSPVTLVVLAILLLPAAASSATSATIIQSTTISGNQLTITGTGFSGTPLTVSFNGQSIPVVSNTATQIVATLNPLPAPGSYRLVVKAGRPASTYSYVAVSRSAINIVTFSSSPVFDASLGSVQKITLTGDASSSTLINAVPGQQLTLMICSDSVAGHVLFFPLTFHVATPGLGADPNTCSVATFVVDEDGETVFMSSAFQMSE